MSKKAKRLIAFFLTSICLILLCSCQEPTNTPDSSSTTTETVKENSNAPYFPAVPDSIIVGRSGAEVALVPGDDDFDEIVSALRGSLDERKNLATVSLAVYNVTDDGLHVVHDIRKKETYVEFIYEKCSPQSFIIGDGDMGEDGAREEIDVKRLFFPITGEYRDCIFPVQSDDYKGAVTLGSLSDTAVLVDVVNGVLPGDTGGVSQ